jgi:PST family polysaccharide transporter
MPEYSIKKAALINAVSKYITVFLNIFFTAILSRILSPKDYGIVAIVGVFISLFAILSDMGLGTAVVQFKEINNIEINHIYTFTFYIAIVLSVVFVLLSFPISFFYNNNIYISICCILSLSVFFNTLNMIPNAILLREKRFLLIGIRLIIVTIGTYALTIILALYGLKYYALVVQSVLSAFLTWIWNCRSVNLKLVLKMNFKTINKIRNYSTYQFFFGIVNFFARNLDKILIGKMMGDIHLAQYDKAYKMMLYPVQNLSQVIGPVLHPILSDFQNDKSYIYKRYIRIVKFLSIMGIFITVVCYWCSREIILIAFGNQWEDAISVFKLLSLSIWSQMLMSSSGGIFQCTGKTKLLFLSGFINACITMIGITIGVLKKSMDSVALFIAIAFSINFILTFYLLIKRCLNVSLSKFIFMILPELISGIVFLFLISFFDNLAVAETLFYSFFIKFAIISCLFLIVLSITRQLKYITVIFTRKKNAHV